MSNAKRRHRRRRRLVIAVRKEAESQRRWDAMGGFDGYLRLVFPPDRIAFLSTAGAFR